jgi:hypothetical protein
MLIINIMVKRKKIKGGADVPTLTKQEVLADPKIKEALQTWAIQQGGKGRRMTGSGWWSDFVDWLKANKVISTASKIGSAIAGAVGFVPLSTALGAVATGSSAYGYGKMNGGMFYNYQDAQAIARGIVGRPAMRVRGRGATSIAYNTPSSEVALLKF